MADIKRSVSQLLVIFADGQPKGSLTAQDMRDFIVTVGIVRVATAVNLLTAGQSIVGVTDTTAVRTITISSADIAVADMTMIIKDESGAAGTNNIIIATEGSQTIDGEVSVNITVNNGVLRIYSDGSNLFSF